MSDTLKIYGETYTDVAGIKAYDPNGNILIFTKSNGYQEEWLVVVSENLHDSSTDIPNVYITAAGVETSYNGWSATDYIPVKPDTWYLVENGSGNNYNAFYDANKQYISGTALTIPSSNYNNNSLGFFKTVSNAAYIRLSAQTDALTNDEIYETMNKIPTGNIGITSNGTVNVSQYDTATVNVTATLPSSGYALENIVPTQTVTPSESVLNAYSGPISSYTEPLETGNPYLVTIDGQYEYVLWCYEGWVNEFLLGDNQVVEALNISRLEAPFCIDSSPSKNVFELMVRTTDSHTVKIDKITFIDETATLSSKTITSNGTYNASTDNVDGYSSVTVNVPTPTPTLQSKTATPSETAQTITADSGYDGLSSVAVGAVSSTYVGSGINRRSSTNLTVNGATVTSPAGYYAESASKSVASGSATTPATTITANPSISINSSGLITATTSASQNITPTVSEGYVSSGTAGTVTVSGSKTQQLTTQAATTYNTSTTDQTIASGRYLTGAQTIKAVTTSNLTAANVKAGAVVQVGDSNDADRIASVTGTFTSDATAAATDIVSGQTAYVNGSKVTGSLVIQHFYQGSSAPSSSLGENGDIYLQS